MLSICSLAVAKSQLDYVLVLCLLQLWHSFGLLQGSQVHNVRLTSTSASWIHVWMEVYAMIWSTHSAVRVPSVSLVTAVRSTLMTVRATHAEMVAYVMTPLPSTLASVHRASQVSGTGIVYRLSCKLCTDLMQTSISWYNYHIFACFWLVFSNAFSYIEKWMGLFLL
jgi:hypothetical protein